MNSYKIQATSGTIPETPQWDDKFWDNAEIGNISHVRPEGNHDFIPQVAFKILHDDNNIYGIYRVQDHYVRAVAKENQESVCLDSCVEFFFKPDVGPGYFNLEMNVGATFLIYYVIDCERTENGFKDMRILPPEDLKLIKVVSDQPKIIEPEITTPLTWHIQFTIPRMLIEKYSGALGGLSQKEWTVNFYKCADNTSHPHWLCWNPVSEFNFHLPNDFGKAFLK